MDLKLSSECCSKLVFMRSIDSTNDYLCREASVDIELWPDFSVLCAAEQTAGRGRNQRLWQSPAGSSLSASILIRNPQGPAHFYGMLLAIAFTESLISQGVQAGLKWPNDILVNERKIAGVLGSVNKEFLVVGIGVNLLQIDLDDTDSVQNLGLDADYDLQLSKILFNFFRAQENFDSEGAQSVVAKLRNVSHTLGKKVRVQTDSGNFTGVATEIDSTGMLVLDNGKHRISGGDILHLRGETF